MLQNAYFLATIGADTAENEREFAENLPKIGNYADCRRRDLPLVAAGRRGAPRREVLTLRAAGVRRPAARRFLRCACYQLGNSMVHLIDGTDSAES